MFYFQRYELRMRRGGKRGVLFENEEVRLITRLIFSCHIQTLNTEITQHAAQNLLPFNKESPITKCVFAQ